ncbi:DNA adenine methylase [Novosphingobium colocasiae]|uniref:site-specific DNA-methyltransferase (cytosine-N(4)-specific) n=1 Tax=Novosphingobium colocasiae TaxID=1256513 RepID=A0A918PBZ0_9SPHN|nr:DNA adenine methylase [Novosphingobium colocasiae]GGY97051.1 modification methylase, putative [Novosphingobium colocasiae]
MLELVRPLVKQRSDLTFKHNKSLGRHGWLRLTPAYSVKLVKEIIASSPPNVAVLDPFSGTATTTLTAAEHGNPALSFDINPFLIWLGNIKCRSYSSEHVALVRRGVERSIEAVTALLKQTNWTPPLFNIERWWSSSTLQVLSALRAGLVKEFGEPAGDCTDGLAWVTFCRLVIETSSAAFNHVSMSFSSGTVHHEVEHVTDLYLAILDTVLASCDAQILGHGEIVEIDARQIPEMDRRFGLVVTSPPYPNRISYIRELRPYMYWMKFLEEAREAGEMDWKAIGGTWGVATSRLNTWESTGEILPKILTNTVENIAKSDGKNAQLLAMYVLKYFHDMHLHLSTLPNALENGAQLHYIVGNSTFFGNLVDTPAILSASMKMLGYADVESKIIRKRNSNKALFEYDVTARWQG